MALKKSDFIEIDYTAMDKESGKLFDTTREKDAKENQIFNPKAQYKPITICIGENQVLDGLDEFLINKEQDKEYEVEISPEKGFGKKDPKLFRMMPAKEFKKQKITPFPGLQVRLDNLMGTIRTVSGGRIMVDFNHPLAGHTLLYKITTHKLVKDDKQKIISFLSFITPNPEVSIKEKTAEILSPIPEPFQKHLTEKIKSLIPEIKEVKYKAPTKK